MFENIDNLQIQRTIVNKKSRIKYVVILHTKMENKKTEEISFDLEQLSDEDNEKKIVFENVQVSELLKKLDELDSKFLFKMGMLAYDALLMGKGTKGS